MTKNLILNSPGKTHPAKLEIAIGIIMKKSDKTISRVVEKLTSKNGKKSVNTTSAGAGSTKTNPDRKTYTDIKRAKILYSVPTLFCKTALLVSVDVNLSPPNQDYHL